MALFGRKKDASACIDAHSRPDACPECGLKLDGLLPESEEVFKMERCPRCNALLRKATGCGGCGSCGTSCSK